MFAAVVLQLVGTVVEITQRLSHIPVSWVLKGVARLGFLIVT